MVNIDITRSSPRCSIIWTQPSPAGSSTGGVLDHTGAITLKDNFTSVASATLGDPVGEEISGVTSG
jgi:hypothetical protein